ncbi:MAG: hypothetical protein QG657_5813, partial [Acidobacteriota bacterium]|nr:hypothetical protein [Acidobacteriota bacterium]
RGVIEIPGLKIKPYELENLTAKFDLSLMVMETEDKLLLEFEYSTKLFKKETIERFISYFGNIVSGVIKNKEQKISAYEITAEEEKKRILFDFNDTAADYPKDKTIHQLFEEQASKMPDNIALVGAGSQTCPMVLTYRQLNEQADSLAGLLIKKGVLADNIVGIKIERSIEMVIGIFGILKAGGAYMPIDPEYPQERVDYMLRDSGTMIMIGGAEERKSGRAEFVFSCFFSASPLPRFLASDSSNLAYIIYTSGTTGQPKGSLIEHRNVVRLMFNDKFQFDFTYSDVWTLFHSFCFDFSVWEMYGALLYGGKLVIVSKMTARDTDAFLGNLTRETVSVLNQTPSAFFNLINECQVSHRQEKHLHLKYVIFGGEALNPSKLKEWQKKFPKTRLINMFGITETTVHVTYKEITEKDIELNIGNIGKPIPTLSAYIVDKYLKPVPVGVAGEILVGGKGVCRGYLNRVELTERKYIENPYKLGDRMYRSGDTGRFLENGEMEYLGRIDQQVKIRGFRIELGEIENRLLQYDGIKDAVVIAEETGTEKYLCAYFVSGRDFTIMELRAHLTGKLPDYMIPSYFVRLEKIPLTSNGKVDRKALPKSPLNVGEKYTAPREAVETKLAAIWSEVLSRDLLHLYQLQTSIGIDDNFFQLGGHSLKATILIAKIHKAFNVKIPLTEIFKRPTIRAFSDYIKAAAGEKYTRIEPLEKKEYYPLSSAQKRLYFLQAMEETGTEYNMPQLLNLEGKIDRERLEDTFVKLLQRHESLRTSFATVGDEPVQRIHENVEFEIEYKNCNLSTDYTDYTDEKDNTIHHSSFMNTPHHSIRSFIRPFDLSKAPLMRVGLLKEDDEKNLLMVDMHHSITDGVSLGILVKEFLSLYRGELLPPLRLQYKDFAGWQNREVVEQKGESILRQEAYWIKEFESGAPVLDLPIDYPKPKVKGFEGRGERFIVD